MTCISTLQFKTRTGGTKTFALVHQNDAAKFFTPESERVAKRVNSDAVIEEDCVSKFIPKGFSSLEEARKLVVNFDTPESVRLESERLSREVYYVLSDKHGAPRLERWKEQGRFDPSATTRMVKDLQLGRFSSETTAPFMRRTYTAPKKPHVGIVIDGSPLAMWSSDEYVPRAYEVAMVLKKACDIVGCSVTAAFGESSDNPKWSLLDGKISIITTPGRAMSKEALALGFHRELYRVGSITAQAESLDNFRILQKNMKMTKEDINKRLDEDETTLTNWRASGIGYALDAVKSLGADLLVFIGLKEQPPRDGVQPDISITGKFSLEEAVMRIATILKQRYDKQLTLA